MHAEELTNITSLDDLVRLLIQLRTEAGNPPFRDILDAIVELRARRNVSQVPGLATIYSCFRQGRLRMDAELVEDIVRALGVSDADSPLWRRACERAQGQGALTVPVVVLTDLPAASTAFTGRTEAIAAIHEIAAAARARGEPACVVIEGMPGVGKTQLALHVARRLCRQGDLRIFVDLRGFDPREAPADPRSVLLAVLDALGVPSDQTYRLTPEKRAARYQHEVAGKAGVIVLDDVPTAEHLQALLPDRAGPLILATSRRTLAELPTVSRQHLPPMPPDEAINLLCRFDPAGRIGTEPDRAAELAGLCGHLPIELVVLGSQLADPHKADWSLNDHRQRLAAFPRDEVSRPALDSSYHNLPGPVRQMFRVLTLHPGGDLSVTSAAALAKISVDAAETMLTTLLREHLLVPSIPGRVAFHDVVRAYANRQLADNDPASRQHDALTRLLDHYLHTSLAAARVLGPHDRHTELHIRPQNSPLLEPVTDHDAATNWFDTERANLVAAVRYAITSGWPTHALSLSVILWRDLFTGGHYTQALLVHEAGLTAAESLGDRRGQMWAHNHLGLTHLRLGAHCDALDHGTASLTIAEEIDNLQGAGTALNLLGVASDKLSRFQQAHDHFTRARDAHRRTGNQRHEALMANNLGTICWRLDRYDEAETHYTDALALAGTGDEEITALAVNGLGIIDRKRGRFGEAVARHQHAHEIFTRIGDRFQQANVRSHLGLAHAGLGDHELALGHQHAALHEFRAIGARDLEADVLNEIAETMKTAGRSDEAAELHHQALTLAAEVGNRFQQARALEGLSDNNPQLLNDALRLYAELGLAETERVRALRAKSGLRRQRFE